MFMYRQCTFSWALCLKWFCETEFHINHYLCMTGTWLVHVVHHVLPSVHTYLSHYRNLLSFPTSELVFSRILDLVLKNANNALVFVPNFTRNHLEKLLSLQLSNMRPKRLAEEVDTNENWPGTNHGMAWHVGQNSRIRGYCSRVRTQNDS